MSGNGQDGVRPERGIPDASASGNGQAAPKAPERPKYGPPATGGGGRMWGQARPVEKSLHFFPSLKRLFGHLAPERLILALVVLLAVAGIVMNVLGPKILGMATDVIFTGVLGKNLPSGATKEQVVAALRAQGKNTFADMVERLNVIPGHGIDFVLLEKLLLVALGLYLVASLFLWLQGYLLNGAVQRSIYSLRSQVEEKVNRLPLSYFDKQTRGELLSRVTNDIDNISQSLQQTDDLEPGGAARRHRHRDERTGTQALGDGHGRDFHRHTRQEPAERGDQGAGGRCAARPRQ